MTIGATQFTFNSQDQVQLPNLNIVTLAVSTLGGSAFVLGTDFSLDPVNGIVTRIPSGGNRRRSHCQYRMELCRRGCSYRGRVIAIRLRP